MDQAEFKAFQKWAHSIKDQEMRVQMVLANPKAVEEKQEVTKKVAEEVQKKTTVKRAKKVTVVKDKYTPEEREAERVRFRREYEKKKKIVLPKKLVTHKRRADGIRFTGKKTIGERRVIIDNRISQLQLHIENAKADIRLATPGTGSAQRVTDAKIRIEKYSGVIKILKKQKSELRR